MTLLAFDGLTVPRVADVAALGEVAALNSMNAPADTTPNAPTANPANSVPLLAPCTGRIVTSARIVLTGKSGTGKSLLLQALAQLIPTTGTLTLNDKPAHHYPMPEWRHRVSLIAQVPQFIAGTVADNLALPYTLSYHQGRSGSHGAGFDRAWHGAHLAQLGKPANFLDKDISVLSGGERQLVNFLRTLQLAPDVLLLDEPTAALDADSARSLLGLIITYQDERLKAGNPCACLCVSHNPADITTLSAEVWQMTADGLNAPNTGDAP